MQTHDGEYCSAEELALAAGGRGRFVLFETCISLVFLTLRMPSRVHFLRPGELGLIRALPYTLVTLLLGWWGIPWGIVYTPLVLLTNLSGGRDVTSQVLQQGGVAFGPEDGGRPWESG